MAKSSILRINLVKSIAPFLALRVSADRIFDQIENSPKKETVVDFSGIESMTRSFAHQYAMRKLKCRKTVSEANVSSSMAEMMVKSVEPVKMAVSYTPIKPMKLFF